MLMDKCNELESPCSAPIPLNAMLVNSKCCESEGRKERIVKIMEEWKCEMLDQREIQA